VPFNETLPLRPPPPARSGSDDSGTLLGATGAIQRDYADLAAVLEVCDFTFPPLPAPPLDGTNRTHISPRLVQIGLGTLYAEG